jgi:sugar phosphate isomerase/epimerase
MSHTPAPRLTVAGHTLGSADFPVRVRAAAAAGFTGVGLRAENYLAARAQGLSDADLLAILAAHGVAVTEVEFVEGWGTAEDRAAAERELEQERVVFHMARLFGVPHVNAGLLRHLPAERITEALAGLCERAGGLRIALEFLPYSGIPTLGTAARAVRECGHPAAALLVDAWHWARSGATAADLAAVPIDRIVAVQLCDVLPEPLPEPRTEALHHRLPPGQGAGDVRGMLTALRAAGARPDVLSVEIASDALREAGPRHAAAVAMASALEVLAASGPLLMPVRSSLG